MNVLETLNQPFPYQTSTRRKLRVAAAFALFIFIFLLVFKPFGLDKPGLTLPAVAIVYGTITFAGVFGCTVLLPPVFPVFFNENTWTTGKQILFITGIVFLVGLANYAVSPLMVDTTWSLGQALWFQGITVAIGLLPITGFILMQQNRLLKKFREEAVVLEKRLQEKNLVQSGSEDVEKGTTTTVNKLKFTGEYQNEILELYPDDLYFITSASNYIKVYHLKKDKLVYTIIRSTLKKAEVAVVDFPNFFRCHRAFIINLDKVVHVQGNAQGYKVHIENYDELIPVSRNLNTEFTDKLLAFRGHFT